MRSCGCSELGVLSAIRGTTSTLETTTFFPLSSAQGSPSLSTCQKSHSTTAALGFLPRRKVPTLVLVVAQPEEQTIAGPQHSTLFLLYLPGVQEVLILAALLSFLSGHWSYASSPLPLHFKSVDAHGRKKGLPCSAGFVICSILKYIPKMPHIFTRETRRKEQKATGPELGHGVSPSALHHLHTSGGVQSYQHRLLPHPRPKALRCPTCAQQSGLPPPLCLSQHCRQRHTRSPRNCVPSIPAYP